MRKQTKSVNTQFRFKDPYGSLSMPVYHTAAYEFDNAKEMADAFTGKSGMPDYSRTMNPTVSFLEDKVRDITGASSVTALSSGMAAISNTLLALASSGTNIITSPHLFGNTFSLICSTLKRLGIRAKLCDMTNPEEVDQAIDDKTCCLFLEIITNPQLEVADLKALAEVAHAKGVPLIADTTIIPFTQFCAKDFGVTSRLFPVLNTCRVAPLRSGGLLSNTGLPTAFPTD